MSLRWADRDPEIEILPAVPVRVTTRKTDSDLRRAEACGWAVIVFAFVYLAYHVIRALAR